MKQALLWLWMLTKRLYKKPTFLVLMLLIPALVMVYGAASREDSGMVTVAVVSEDHSALAQQVIDGLQDDGQLLRYVLCDDAQKARTLVSAGKADMAWILEADLEAKVQRFAQDPRAKNAFVTVLVRQDNVALRLAREKLSGQLFALCAREVYVSYVRQNLPGLDHLTDEALLTYYENTSPDGELFAFDEADAAAAQSTHYLTAPLRGLLAVVAVLCGLATALYHMEDLRRGTFGWLSATRRSLVELGCQLISLVNVTVVSLIALAVLGLTGALWREVAALVLYCVCVASFCALLRRLCGSQRLLAALLPPLVVAMLLVCPVFFDLAGYWKYLLPPTFYVEAAYSNTALLGMLAHTLTTASLYALFNSCLVRRDN